MTNETEATIKQRVMQLQEHFKAITDYKEIFFKDGDVIKAHRNNYAGFGIVDTSSRPDVEPAHLVIAYIHPPSSPDGYIESIGFPIDYCTLPDKSEWPQWVKDFKHNEAVREIRSKAPSAANFLGLKLTCEKTPL